jgi:hypothetical protein
MRQFLNNVTAISDKLIESLQTCSQYQGSILTAITLQC